MTEQINVSASLYTTWKKCPVQARGRLDGHYQPDTIDTFRGLLAHRIFARHINQGPIPVTEFALACKQEIGSSNLNWKMRDLGISGRQLEGIILVVSDLYARFRTVAKRFHPVKAEIHLEAPFGDHKLVGRIDAESSVGQLIDWKTGELGDAADQLRFYATLHRYATGAWPSSTLAVSVTTGEVHSEWIDPRKDDLTFELTEMIAELLEGAVTETPGPWCQWCPLLETCEPGTRALTLIG